MTAPDPDTPVALKVACPSADVPRDIAKAAVEAELAACANIVTNIESVFRWKGAVETEPEAVAWFTTRQGCVADLAALIRARHPYDLAAITWSLAGAEAETAAWIRETTAANPR